MLGSLRKWIGISAATKAARVVAFGIFALAAAAAFLSASGMRGNRAQDFSDIAKYVFVPASNAPSVIVLDKDSDQLIGDIALPFVPKLSTVSFAAQKLIAADGTQKKIVVVNLENGGIKEFVTDFVPERLVTSANGTMVAAANLSNGVIAFIGLMQEHQSSETRDLSAIRDVLFGADGAFLYIASDAFRGVGVIDVARGKVIDDIALDLGPDEKVTGLTRSPNGRDGYAKIGLDGPIAEFDLDNFRSRRSLDAGQGASKAFPTGFGHYLIIPDNADRTLSIVGAGSAQTVAAIDGVADMATVYSGWFDTTAFVPSASQHLVAAYDLDRLAKVREIELPDIPGQGAVTQDGTKLYLPMPRSSAVAVIDVRTRQLVHVVKLGVSPVAALLGRSFDICH